MRSIVFCRKFPVQTNHMINNRIVSLTLLLLFPIALYAQLPPDSTYADRLGFPWGARVLIIHVDDAGMSLESNDGAINALTTGAATSVSVMMPCPWVPGFVKWLKSHPDI